MTATGTGRSLSELERTWFAERTTSSNFLNDMKREYYASKVGRATDTQHTPLGELEGRWLDSLGGTSNRYDEAWQMMAAKQSVRVGRNTDETKRNFYATVTTSP
jgi:hypothetical protein